jgi:type I restriction enzyme R subunit
MCKLLRHIAPVSQPNWPRKFADFLRIRHGGTNDAKRLPGPGPAIRHAFVAIQAHLYQ